MTFAGTVGIKASGGPANKFCFGRVDDPDGTRSIPYGIQGVNACGSTTGSDSPCEVSFRWPGQMETDPARCNLTQSKGRLKESHSVGLIYVYPDGPAMNSTPPYHQVHTRSARLSALEVRETFKVRMGWTDRETVALTVGGHTLGRTHGSCNLTGTRGGEALQRRGTLLRSSSWFRQWSN